MLCWRCGLAPPVESYRKSFNTALVYHLPWVCGGDSVKLAVPVGFSIQGFLLQASDGVVLCFMVNSEVSSLHKGHVVKNYTVHFKPENIIMFIWKIKCASIKFEPKPSISVSGQSLCITAYFLILIQLLGSISNLGLLPASEVNVVSEEVTHAFLAHLALQRL